MKIFFGFIITLALVNLFASPKAIAQEKIDSFHVDVTAQENGDLSVLESINYDFGSSYRHGIYRYIPLVSRVGDLYRVIDVSFTKVSRDGKKEKFKIDNSGDKIEVKIGDPDRKITGSHLYEIGYLVRNAVGSNYSDHDEIYWNVTGNGWEVPISSASVSFKDDFGVPIKKAACYTGGLGSRGGNCQVKIENNSIAVYSNSALANGEGLTFVAGFPVGTFPKSILQKNKPMDPDLKVLLMFYGFAFIALNFILAPYLLYKYLKKRNKVYLGPPVVNFDLPETDDGSRITPSEAGTVDNTKLEKMDIVATIFDLAIRKYIKIEGVESKKMLGLIKDQDFKISRLKNTESLNIFESKLLNSLFSGKKSVSLKDVQLSYTIFGELEKKNFSMLISRKLFIKNPKAQKGACLAFGLAGLFTGFIVIGPVLIYLSAKLNGRTEKGDEMDWKLDGLKIFLKATKRYDIWQTKNFIFLEKMIPYAMALGVIEEYMKELKILKPDYSPSWYSGRGSFYAMYPLFSSAAGSGVTTTAPSSSSGFSGGSGGGGGGGGGGSW